MRYIMAVSLTTLRDCKKRGEKFAMITCYDTIFAQTMNAAGVECLLVGDSLGMVLQGHSSTLPVTMQDMIYHTQCVARGNSNAFLLADMPFMSYATVNDALNNAAALMRVGAHAVKLEGGAWLAETVQQLVRGGIPSCVHMGLTPQSIYKFGTYTVRAKEEEEAQKLIEDAKLLEQLGCFALVLEKIPAELAKK